MSAPPLERGGKPDLSIVVCSRNGAQKLPIALNSLAGQTLDAERYEVIVVDDGSTDATSRVGHSLGVRVMRLDPGGGLAAARNAGASAARGELVAFTDDDCEVDGRWATEILAPFADPEVDGVGGRILPESSHSFARRFLIANNPLTPLKDEHLKSNGLAYRLLLYLRHTIFGDSELPDRLYSVVGANMAFRRELIFELGGFDEKFWFGSEEEDFCLRASLRPQGAHLTYAHGAVVTHWFAGAIGDSLRRSRAYGRGNARRALKHPHTGLIVFPFPLGVVGLFCLGAITRRSRIAGLALALPLLTYPRWVAHAREQRSVEPAVYPYIQLAQEAASMVGELEGLRAGYQPVPSRHLSSR